jgi:hypothetical protein
MDHEQWLAVAAKVDVMDGSIDIDRPMPHCVMSMRENPDGFPSSPGASRAAAPIPIFIED